MTRNRTGGGSWLPWLVVAVLIAWLAWPRYQDRIDDPVPPGQDLLQDMRRQSHAAQARQDARMLAAVCRSIASVLEYDGRLEQPAIRTGVQADALRRLTRELALSGQSFRSRYPHWPEIIGRFLEQHLGTDGGPLSAEQRQRWVAAYRQLADAADWAAGAL